MQFDRAKFLQQSQRLDSALGHPLTACTPEVRAEADRVVGGEIIAVRSPELWHRVGLENIDWECRASQNREWAAMALLRFSFLPTLASAFRETRDERYAASARHYILECIRDLGLRTGWKPMPFDGATQYDIRISGWLQSLPAFLDSRAFDDAFLEVLSEAVRAKLAHLSGHVFPGSNNIRLLHGDVLLLNAFRLSFLPEAAAWQAQGVTILNDELCRQILPDGAHVEAVPGYHLVVLPQIYNYWRLARALPELGLALPTDAVSRMADYSVASRLPNGGIVPMHDSIGRPGPGPHPNEALARRREFRRLAGLPPDELPPLRQCYPDAGQVFLRDAWTPAATFVAFDATAFGGWHWHPGRNAIHLAAHGRALLTDSGYPFAKPGFPAYGTATAQHSTLNLNGWSQARTAARLRYRSAPGYDLVEGLYDGGYWPFGTGRKDGSTWAMAGQSHGDGIYGEHHRMLLWIHGRCMVVIDTLATTSEAGKKPRLESVWQLSEGPATLEPERRRALTHHPDANLLMLFPLMPEGMQMAMHEGERDPYRGWLALNWGDHYTPAPMIRCFAEAYDPWNADLATVLVPFAGARPPVVTAEAVAPALPGSQPAIGRLTLRWGDGTTDEVHWSRRLETPVRETSGLDTDAALVHLRRGADGRVAGGVVVDGTYLRPHSPEKRPGLAMFALGRQEA